MSADGLTVAIGAIGNYAISGHVRVVRWDGATWNQLGADIDGEASGDQSGWSVAMSADGLTVAVGAIGNDGYTGHVRVVQYNETHWNRLGDDIDGQAAADQSGRSVAMSADGLTVAIGAVESYGSGDRSGYVRVVRLDGATWIPLGADIDGEAGGDQFGWSVAMSADGLTVAVGARNNDNINGANSGHVKALYYNETHWNLLGEFYGDARYAQLGCSVDISADGSTIAIGAIGVNSNTGIVRVFDSPALRTCGSVILPRGLREVCCDAATNAAGPACCAKVPYDPDVSTCCDDTWLFQDPSSQPSSQPSQVPSDRPSSNPSSQPSSQPSQVPSDRPSSEPSSQRSDRPSSEPSSQPSSAPSKAQPSQSPSDDQSAKPSQSPSDDPSAKPSQQRTSAKPSQSPSDDPSAKPSQSPSAKPSAKPSQSPSAKPSQSPSATPPGKNPPPNPATGKMPPKRLNARALLEDPIDFARDFYETNCDAYLVEKEQHVNAFIDQYEDEMLVSMVCKDSERGRIIAHVQQMASHIASVSDAQLQGLFGDNNRLLQQSSYLRKIQEGGDQEADYDAAYTKQLCKKASAFLLVEDFVDVIAIKLESADICEAEVTNELEMRRMGNKPQWSIIQLVKMQ